MRILNIQDALRHEISQYGSHEVSLVPLLHSEGELSTVVISLRPGGCLGMHEAGGRQLFWVIEGSGWVSAPDGARQPIAKGQAALWEAGEWHQTDSDEGLTAVVFEGEQMVLKGTPQ